MLEFPGIRIGWNFQSVCQRFWLGHLSQSPTTFLGWVTKVTQLFLDWVTEVTILELFLDWVTKVTILEKLS